VTVGHNVILHSTTIGDNSLIGMGSTLLNRSRIGSHCLIGANTLVPEGKEFADGSLIVGVPGRVARPLREAEHAIFNISAQTYVHNYRRFKDGLKRLD
jgi:carbonic anhydrase/acetyltransferase-like protein (isoleucine patch superfamily)